MSRLRAKGPMGPDNFNGNFDGAVRNNQYSAGQDILFSYTWRLKNGLGTAANETRAGVAVPVVSPTYATTATIKIYSTGGTLKRTLTVTALPTASINYTNANLVTDFGSEPASFIAKLFFTENGYDSITLSITITKV